ncbi:MAG: GGDEF domain-containing protein [Lachnospiraceae bacterium]|nr:GGDEF domain-containing protein [Lachnospiraceae bacterium]
MKKKSIVNNIIHFLVQNCFMFTVAVMGMVHLTLLGVSWFAGVMPMVYINACSVAIYLLCVLLCRFGHIMPVYICIFAEVTSYAVLSIFLIGWRSGAYLFLFSIVPIILYFGCYLFKGLKRGIIVSTLLVIDFAEFVALYFYLNNEVPFYQLSFGFNSFYLIFTTFVMVFSVIFYNVIYIYSNEVELTNLTQQNVKLTADASKDALTGLLNRRGFLPIVNGYMNGKKKHHFCIAFFDIDNFKKINDSFGHDCGDEVLKHISKLIEREMHGCDICRWGGEEFVILMRDYDFEVAKQKMEYIRMFIEATPTIVYTKRIPATITIGIEEMKEKYQEPEDIIKVADGRMYYGKQHGKNVVIFADMID